MRRRRYRKRYKIKRRGHGILPYIKNNNVYFGGKVQRVKDISSGPLSKVIPLTGGLISLKIRRKNNYVMRKLHTPKRVTLPNGRTFLARYNFLIT